MKYKKELNRVVIKLQQAKSINRTKAIMQLAASYSISYPTLFKVLKHGQLPDHNRLLAVLDQIIGDFK